MSEHGIARTDEVQRVVDDRRRVTNLLSGWCAVLSVFLLLSIAFAAMGFAVAEHGLSKQARTSAVRASNTQIFCVQLDRVSARVHAGTIDCAALQRAIQTNKPVPPGQAR